LERGQIAVELNGEASLRKTTAKPGKIWVLAVLAQIGLYTRSTFVLKLKDRGEDA
jgi:hypothetical protein